MKKNRFLSVFILLLIVSANCFAQSSNNEQRLIGTWIDLSDDTIVVFSSDGIVNWFGTNYKYGVAGNKLAIIFTGFGEFTMVYDYVISSDGRTLILSFGDGIAVDQKNNGILFRKKT